MFNFVLVALVLLACAQRIFVDAATAVGGDCTTTKCVAGAFCNSGTKKCDACPTGKASKEGSTAAAQCDVCAAGYAGPAGAAAGCTQCVKGTFATENSTVCTPCATGSWAAAGAGGCTACPHAFSTSGNTADTVGSVADCKVCAAGYFGSNTGSLVGVSGCDVCPSGKYSEINSKTCKSCAAGTYTPVVPAGKCTSCPAGKYADSAGSGACTDCKQGYSSVAGSSVCGACAEGYVGTSKDGQTGCEEKSAKKGREPYGSTNMGTAVVIAVFAIMLVVAFGVFCIGKTTHQTPEKGFQMVSKV